MQVRPNESGGTRRGLSLQTLALIATAVFSATQMMAFVLYPYFADTMNLPLSSVIASFSLGSFLFLWASPFWSRCQQRLGVKAVLAVGLGGLLLSQIALLFLVSKSSDLSARMTSSLLWISRIVYGLTAAAIVPIAQIIMAESSLVKERMKAMTRQSLSLHLGRLLGPFLVWLGLLYSARGPLWLCVGLILLLLLGLMPHAQTRNTSPSVPNQRSWSWPQSSQAWVMLTIAFTVTALVGVVQASLSHSLQTKLQLDVQGAAPVTLRFLLASSFLSVVIQLLLQSRIKHPWQGTFPLGAFCLVTSTWLLARFQSESELWMALPLFASGLALLSPSYAAALSLTAAGAQGSAAGLLAAVHTLGYTSGGLSCAALMALGLSPWPGGFVFAGLLLLLIFCIKAPELAQLPTFSRERS